MKYYLGLDNGGTTTKAAVFDSGGKMLSSHSVSTQMSVPQPGFAERDMEKMWQDNCLVIREALKRSGLSPKEISGVSVCGHGKGLYLWGKDGRPVRAGILSADNRAWKYPLEWEEDGTAAAVYARSCQKILASQAPALLAWLRDNEPRCSGGIRWIFECKDYIRFRLTGEARGEITDYSGANLMNLKTGSYDRELMRLYGLETLYEALPPLCRADELAGFVTRQAAEMTGLCAGTPVAGGMFDVDACALGVGLTRESELCMIAGTWSINEYIRRDPVLDGSVMLNSYYCMPEFYLVEESSPTSAGNLTWFLQVLMPELKDLAGQQGRDVYRVLEDMAAAVPPQELCPVFSPFLMGSNVHPNAKASLVGLSSYHTRGHILRGIFEGIAFCHRAHYDKLAATNPQGFDCIRLAGGAANSPLWAQMFADVMNLPVLVAGVGETGALGCAIAASVATGEYPGIRQAAQAMVQIQGEYRPRPKYALMYQAKKRFYDQINQSLDGVWADLQGYVGGEYV